MTQLSMKQCVLGVSGVSLFEGDLEGATPESLSLAVVANTLQLPQLHCPQAGKPANLHY
jgi:hypothetical protein